MKTLNTKNGSSNVSTSLESAENQPIQSTPINTPWGKIFSSYANDNRRVVEVQETALVKTGADDALLSERELNRSNKRVARSVAIVSSRSNGDNDAIQGYIQALAALGVVVTTERK